MAWVPKYNLTDPTAIPERVWVDEPTPYPQAEGAAIPCPFIYAKEKSLSDLFSELQSLIDHIGRKING